jgi:hypothetical protein
MRAAEHPLSRRRHPPLSIQKVQECVVQERRLATQPAMDYLFAQHRINPPNMRAMPSHETINPAVMA